MAGLGIKLEVDGCLALFEGSRLSFLVSLSFETIAPNDKDSWLEAAINLSFSSCDIGPSLLWRVTPCLICLITLSCISMSGSLFLEEIRFSCPVLIILSPIGPFTTGGGGGGRGAGPPDNDRGISSPTCGVKPISVL